MEKKFDLGKPSFSKPISVVVDMFSLKNVFRVHSSVPMASLWR